MIPSEINVRIAELCGWKQCPGSMVCWQKDGIIKTNKSLPDYCNDLNAIAEACETLEPIKQREFFPVALTKVVAAHEGFKPHLCSPWHIINATAEQRARAFLACFPASGETK